jgi:hypothetical protein
MYQRDRNVDKHKMNAYGEKMLILEGIMWVRPPLLQQKVSHSGGKVTKQ